MSRFSVSSILNSVGLHNKKFRDHPAVATNMSSKHEKATVYRTIQGSEEIGRVRFRGSY